MASAPARAPSVSPPSDSSTSRLKPVVEVWRCALDVPEATLDRLCDSLALDEVERAFRFRFDVDRMRFIAARGTLRSLLASYLALAPAEIPLSYGPLGKPGLDPALRSDLEFNLSHSGGVALFAFARGRRVGIDLEQMTRGIDTAGIAALTLTPHEQRRLEAGPASDRRASFYRLWTQKEAVVKAGGEGLTRELSSFEIVNQPGGALVIDGGDEAAVWRLCDLPAPEGFVASLAVEGSGASVRSRRVSDINV